MSQSYEALQGSSLILTTKCPRFFDVKNYFTSEGCEAEDYYVE